MVQDMREKYFSPTPDSEPTLRLVAIADLRPTQIGVGMREVAEKRRRWRDRKDKAEYLGSHK
jgi:hypothetical protein